MATAIKETISSLLGKAHGPAPDDEAPRQPSLEEFQQLQQKYVAAGQGHVFAFADELSSVEKARLFQQLSSLDPPERINDLANKALNPPSTTQEQTQTQTLEPLPEAATASILDSDPNEIRCWYEAGLQLVADNKVAVVLMAGGQGTRLGSSAPKGCFDIGLPSHKSLFQIQAERIAKLQALAKNARASQTGKQEEHAVVIPWYVMTSGPTRKPTEEFFQQHSYFGLDKRNVIFFEQGVLPCISNEGKIMMESKSRVWSH